MQIGDLINRLYELRQEKDSIAASLSEMNKEIDSIEFEILKDMETSGLDKMSTPAGTVTRKVELYPQVEDLSSLVQWAAENGRPEILQKRVSKAVFDEIYKDTGEYPGGINTYNKETLSFRKAR